MSRKKIQHSQFIVSGAAQIVLALACVGCVVDDVYDAEEAGDSEDSEGSDGVDDFRVITAGEKVCSNYPGTVDDDNYCWDIPIGESDNSGYEVTCASCDGENVGWLYHPGVWNGPNYSLPYYSCEGISVNRQIMSFSGAYLTIENDCSVCEDAPLPFKCFGQDEESQAQNWHLEATPSVMCAGIDGAGHHVGTSGFYPMDSSGGCSFIPGATALFTCEPVDGVGVGFQECQGFELGTNDLINSGAVHEPAARTQENCGGVIGPTMDGCYAMNYNCYGRWYKWPNRVYDGTVSLNLCG